MVAFTKPSERNSPSGPLLGTEAALQLARRELQRLGLNSTHRLDALYATPDAHAEGADFAATLERHDGRTGAGTGLKLLISCDGRVAVCPFERRCARACRIASRS